jgi:hypothetical protein
MRDRSSWDVRVREDALFVDLCRAGRTSEQIRILFLIERVLLYWDSIPRDPATARMGVAGS